MIKKNELTNYFRISFKVIMLHVTCGMNKKNGGK